MELNALSVYFLLIGISLYLLGVYSVLVDRTTSYRNRHDIFSTGNYDPIKIKRNATPKDMWYAVLWPIRVPGYVLFGLLDTLNSLIQFPLLLIGIRYKDSNLDRKIRMYLEGKY